MSLVYITYHNENVFDIDADLGKPPRSKKLYVSKYKKPPIKPDVINMPDGKLVLTSSKKSRNKTMGFAETYLNPPCDYLKKHHGVKWQRLKEHFCPKDQKRNPPVPPRLQPKKPDEIGEKPVKSPAKCVNKYFKGHKHRANFVVINIQRMKSAQTKKPTPQYVDTPNGDKHNLIQSGLLPRFSCTKRFGKVPCYLEAHKKMLADLRAKCDEARKYVEMRYGVKGEDDRCLKYLQLNAKQLSEEEKQQIVEGLKTNFNEVFANYQAMSLYTDTSAKKLRKTQLENEMRQIEQDIALMASNKTIFVSDF